MFINTAFPQFHLLPAQQLGPPIVIASCQSTFRHTDRHHNSTPPPPPRRIASLLNPLTPTVAVWVQLWSILCQTRLSRHL